MSISRKRTYTNSTKQEISNLNQLNARFQSVIAFTDLKKFNQFSDVKQWIEIEQNAIVRQIIFVMISLLINKWFHALNFIRIFVDFVLIAQYRSHNEKILQYMNHVLYWMNCFKSVFRHLRSFDKDINEEHFNFSKFHVMSHYIDFIRKYETTDEYDISHDEIKHKYMLKKYYIRINKRDIFQTQLINHNERRLKILIMKNIMNHTKRHQFKLTELDISIINTRLTRDSIDLALIDEMKLTSKKKQNWNWIMKRFNWCWAYELVVATNELDLISILTAFVREKRRATDETSSRNSNKYRRNKDSTWANKLYVSVHAFLTCWVRNENDSLNLNKLIEEKMRCKSQWQNKNDEWRRDFVWI
jgi:hypothetical protein